VDVIELELARTGIAGQHADDQEHQQQRRAKTQRKQARQDAGHHQRRAKQNGYADLIERCHAPKSLQILSFASLSPPHFDANRFLERARDVPESSRRNPQPTYCIDGIDPSIVGFSVNIRIELARCGLK